MAKPLSLLLIQTRAHQGDVAQFADRAERLTKQYPNSQVLVYPEMHLCELSSVGGDRRQRFEPLDGPRDRALAEIAGDLKIWLVPGTVYESDGPHRTYNTALVYSPNGRRVASYRKIAPWRPYETLTPGVEFVTFDIANHGRIGLTVCYDAWFPEIFRHVAWMGADLILNLVQTPTSDREQEVILARANAIVNQSYVASINAAHPNGVGRSLLVDPQGRVLSQASSAEEVVLSEVIDLEEARRVRKYGTCGLNQIWRQFQPGDTPLPLPLYSGEINPAVWEPGAYGQTHDLD